MAKKQDVLTVIYAAIDDHNEQLADDEGQKPLAKESATVLFGKGAGLDSLALVSLVLEVESLLEERLDLTVSLADERAMSRRQSPFRTVETLSEYVLEFVEEA